jgi:PIN domain nuclease of toxin-antitoxin system
MRILFDSHALFWFVEGDRKFSSRARAIVETPDAVLIASAVCAWELANKVRIGKWSEAAQFADGFVDAMRADGFELLPITPEHARVAGFLPGTHRDPFDRMLAAQAQIEGVPLVTADPVFKEFGTRVIW